ncbi:hypothetical protein D3C86_1247450 [compost metagenome]
MKSGFSGSNLTHKFGRKVKVGGKHILWHALYKFWEILVEMMVAFFCRHSKKIFDTHLCGA